MNNRLTEAYISILKEELLMATGCTEPIAIAYCAAKMRDILGGEPERIEAEVSGNILKNVKSVIVPNTGGMKGINAAIAAGIIAGRAEKVLQVISYVTQEEHSRIREYMEVTPLAVSCSDNGRMLDIRLTGYRGGDSAMVHIANNHSNIIREERNGAVLMELPPSDSAEDNLQDKSVLNIEDIVRFADTVDVELVKPLLDNQIRCNSAIAEEGLRGDWGANVGRVLLSEFGSDIKNEARAYAAAASDARMSGCELPVVIVTGSGNQGITATLPVVVYGEECGASREQMIRALTLSHLTVIYIKQSLGRLSALCGCVVAASGSSCGITYLMGGNYEHVCHSVKNMIANITGMICDGAKPSCSLKISSGVSTAVLSALLSMEGKCVSSAEGIIDDDVDRSIRNLTSIGADAMATTDNMVLDIMTHKC